jgi:hypothetical protein
MKSSEFVTEDIIDTDMADRNKRLARLKAEVEAGMEPTIDNVSRSTSPTYTMGDLEDLDWMEKEYTHDSEGEVDGWIRHYHGPKPVKVRTRGAESLRVLNPGEVLE